jgi:hypothetical protein
MKSLSVTSAKAPVREFRKDQRPSAYLEKLRLMVPKPRRTPATHNGHYLTHMGRTDKAWNIVKNIMGMHSWPLSTYYKESAPSGNTLEIHSFGARLPGL